MILLHAGSGSWEINLLAPHSSPEEWAKLRANIVRLLTARKRPGVGLLEKLPWELYDGTNWFGDEFCVLYAKIPIDQYVEAAEFEHSEPARTAAKALASAFNELGTPIRFVAFEPDTYSAPAAVATPVVKATAAATSRALNDAERLLQTNGPISAVDRVHTALHGYMRELCVEAEIDPGSADTTNAIWKKLKKEHPALAQGGAHSEHITRIVAGIATILDALNPVRNRGSVAHANEELLSEANAMLAVNAARTILHYLEASVRS